MHRVCMVGIFTECPNQRWGQIIRAKTWVESHCATNLDDHFIPYNEICFSSSGFVYTGQWWGSAMIDVDENVNY